MRIDVVLCGLIALCLSSVAAKAAASLIIKVDKSAQTMTVKRDGKILHTWPVSTGTTGYATPSGTFTPFRMEADHYSKEWDDAPMPHAVFFTTKGHAIHGSYQVRRLGRPASHGCVRLAPANAARLFSLVKKAGLANTRVQLMGNERVALPRARSRSRNAPSPKGEAKLFQPSTSPSLLAPQFGNDPRPVIRN